MPDGPARAVLVTIDTLRADHVGGEPSPTPALDAVAARGTRFETAISPAPLTLPAHTTLLTGVDPPRHGVRANGAYRLGPELPTLAEALGGAGLATAAFVSAFVLERRFGLARGFEHYDDALGVQLDDIGVASRPAGETVDAALAWLEHAPDRFFLWLHLYDPHAPYEPPEPYRARHPGDPYTGEIAYADAEVGRLLAAIDARHPDGGTLVVVTSDHGESLGEHGEPTHAFGVYDATQRVPLLLAGPGVPSGEIVTPLVRLADVAPTMLELFGLEPGAEMAPSLLPLLAGASEPETRVAWVETLATQLDMGWSPLLGARTERFKYVRAPRPELYDLAEDPGETNDLAATQPARVAELDAWVASQAADQRTTPNQAVDGDTAARLRALGYLTAGEGDGRTLGVVGGTDPKDAMPELETLREALTALKQHRGEEAFSRFAALEADGFEIELLRAEAALLAGRLDAALAATERAAALDPERVTRLVLAGRIAERRGDATRARAAFAEAGERDPEAGGAWLGLGRVAEANGDLARARAHYERAAALKRVEAEAIWRLAALDLEAGRADAARARLAALPQRFVRSPDAAARLARAERAAGRLDLARLRVEGSLREYPEAAELTALAVELATASAEGEADENPE